MIAGPGSSAQLVLADGTVFEGIVEQAADYGMYLFIGGDPNRLSLFPWHTISRVIYTPR